MLIRNYIEGKLNFPEDHIEVYKTKGYDLSNLISLDKENSLEERIYISRVTDKPIDSKVSVAIIDEKELPFPAFVYVDLTYGVTIVFNKDLVPFNDYDYLKMLMAHELCHAEQVLSGRSIIEGDKITFEGVEYLIGDDYDDPTKYVALPFEVEAFKAGALAIGTKPLTFIMQYLDYNCGELTDEIIELYS